LQPPSGIQFPALIKGEDPAIATIVIPRAAPVEETAAVVAAAEVPAVNQPAKAEEKDKDSKDKDSKDKDSKKK
jgi:large subunit ribosomal protein L25